MGRAVGTDQAGAIKGKQHRQILIGHIVDDLIVTTLQEGRVDGNDRLQAITSHTGRDVDAVLLGDGDIEITGRIFALKAHQARAFAHGRRDRDQAAVFGGHVAHPGAEDIAVVECALFAGSDDALMRIEGAHAVILDRIGLGRRVALALFGDDVQQLRAAQLLHIAQRVQQRIHVMAVDRSDVIEAEFFEQSAGHDQALDVFLGAACQLPHRRHLRQDLLAALAHRRIELARQDLGEAIRQRANVGRDRHIVIVQDHQQVGVEIASMIERLEGHTGGHRAVTDDGHRATVGARQLGRDGHAESGADGGTRMAHAEGVIDTLLALRKRREALGLADRAQTLLAASQNLMWVGLMADIPHDTILGGVVQVVQGDSEFDGTETGGKVAAACTDRCQQKGTHFGGHLLQCGFGQRTQISREFDLVQQRVIGTLCHGASILTDTGNPAAGRELWEHVYALQAKAGALDCLAVALGSHSRRSESYRCACPAMRLFPTMGLYFAASLQ